MTLNKQIIEMNIFEMASITTRWKERIYTNKNKQYITKFILES